MTTYEDFKKRFYEIFKIYWGKRPEEEMWKYLQDEESEAFIRQEYEADIALSDDYGHPGIITDSQIHANCDNLEMLY